MRLKTYHAENVQSAMELVRSEMGDDAVILTTKRAPGGRGVVVTVAQEMDEQEAAALQEVEKARRKVKGTATLTAMPDYLVRDIERVLQRHGVSEALTRMILDETRHIAKPADDSPASIQTILGQALSLCCRFAPMPYLDEPLRLIFIGPPGCGKTLTTAKFAARIVQAGEAVQVVTTDHKRAGGVEQLSAFTDILGVELKVASSRQELKSLLAGCHRDAPVLIDSAGANPYDFHELKELADFASLMELKPVLVYPAGGDPADAAEIAEAFSFLGVEKMVVTRLDLTRRLGSVLTAAHAANLTLAHFTASEKVLGDFHDATPGFAAAWMMRYQGES